MSAELAHLEIITDHQSCAHSFLVGFFSLKVIYFSSKNYVAIRENK